jgi:hypothetical protein
VPAPRRKLFEDCFTFFLYSCLAVSFFTPSRHTRSVSLPQGSTVSGIREELALTVIGIHPSLAASSEEVTVNFTIPGHKSRGGLFWIETT